MTPLAAALVLLLTDLIACSPTDDVAPPELDPAADASDAPADASSPPVDTGQDTVDGGDPPVVDARVVTRVEPCDPIAHLICTGFEDGLPAEPNWTVSRWSAPLVSIDEERAAHGTRSLLLRPLAPEGGATAVISTTVPFPIENDRFYGRAYFYVPSPAPGPHSAQLVSVYAAEGSSTQWSVGFRDPEMHANVNDPGGRGEIHERSTTPLPLDRWFCLEWMMDGRTPELRVWLDGESIDDLRADDWPTASWGRIQVGIRKHADATDPEEGYRVWVDDVALDDTRIGC